MINSTKFSMDDLVRLTSYPKRTIRYYVQFGLMDHPKGEGRASHYTTDHLRQLLEIKKLTEYGLSLDAIRTHLKKDSLGTPPPPNIKPGSVQIQSKVFIAPGLDVLIRPDETELTPDEIRHLVKGLLEHIKILFEERGLSDQEKLQLTSAQREENLSKVFHKISGKNIVSLDNNKGPTSDDSEKG
jgi:DNA-binding transcriptional MerR regulator